MKILDLLRDYFPEKKILESVDIENVCMDSREVKKGSLFFAIKGGNNHVKRLSKMMQPSSLRQQRFVDQR
ncbi:hypothetical protein [uncultured Ilyobacter sp.]|uniref:hypothetical protein n=1 Tax=uncultured Ilyobacter sp. TaxID=544433 RepID=UPI0029C02FC2|nr:hypothetical protein [uncultured Ilyobacter sp.]